MGAGCRIRPARADDAPRFLPIEREAFSDPWSELGFREALETPIGFGLVAEQEDRVVGYLLGRLVVPEAEILNVAVAASVRGQGIGRALVESALGLLAERGVREVFLEVRASNAVALRLYHSVGFRVSGVRRRYYRLPSEDALVLRRDLGVPA
jgi:ribosomal-protein-alanine N-acetyltransferase